MSDQDLVVDYDMVDEALYYLKKCFSPCEDSSHEVQRMTGDQVRAKWGAEPAAVTFGNRYHDFLVELRKQIDYWQDDLVMLMKRVDQAQERLRDASESEAAMVDQMLADEWFQGSGSGQPAGISAQLPR